MASFLPLHCRCDSLHRRETFFDQFESANLVVIPPPFSTLTTQPLQFKLTLYPRRSSSLMDLNPRPLPEPPDPPDPPDRANPSQSKTFTVNVSLVPQLELVLVDLKNFLVLLVSHSLLAPPCDVVNLRVSTILKPRTLDVFVVSFDGLSLTRAGSSIVSLVPLSKIYVNPATDVGGIPLRRPDMFLISLRRKASSSDISLPHSILSIPHVWPPPPFRPFTLGGNPLRRPGLSHLFVNLASDVGGNPLRRPALSHQKIVRSVCWRTTLTSSIMECNSLPCLLSMNGENFSVSFPSFSFSLLTGLLPCGAVCTGPEGAIETTSVFIVGEDCFSTSLMTISQLSDFVLEALSTHSSLVLNSLSTSYEDLSCLFLFAIVVHELFQEDV